MDFLHTEKNAFWTALVALILVVFRDS